MSLIKLSHYTTSGDSIHLNLQLVNSVDTTVWHCLDYTILEIFLDWKHSLHSMRRTLCQEYIYFETLYHSFDVYIYILAVAYPGFCRCVCIFCFVCVMGDWGWGWGIPPIPQRKKAREVYALRFVCTSSYATV